MPYDYSRAWPLRKLRIWAREAGFVAAEIDHIEAWVGEREWRFSAVQAAYALAREADMQAGVGKSVRWGKVLAMCDVGPSRRVL